MQLIQSIESGILLFIQDQLRCGLINAIMIFFSSIGTVGLIWIAGGIAMLLTKKYRQAGILLLICLAVTWLLNDLLVKNLIRRERPYITLLELRVLVPLQTDFSFPSGHTSTSFASAYAITRKNGRRWAWVYAVAGMIAVSRLFVGIHYPTDVLAGIVFGTLVAVVAYAAAQRFIFSGRGARNADT